MGVAVAWTQLGARFPHGLDTGRQLGQYKPVQGGTRPQRRTGGVPGHLGHVGMYIPASTHTHLFMWPTCWAPVPRTRTPQTLTGIGFMYLGVGPTGQGGVVLFVNPGQGGVGA